jgi:hypothetical protein
MRAGYADASATRNRVAAWVARLSGKRGGRQLGQHRRLAESGSLNEAPRRLACPVSVLVSFASVQARP